VSISWPKISSTSALVQRRFSRSIGLLAAVGYDEAMVFHFQSKSEDRWGDGVSPEGVLDMALRGTREQWWELYERARSDTTIRNVLRRELLRADPDLRGGAALWRHLLDHFDGATEKPQ